MGKKKTKTQEVTSNRRSLHLLGSMITVDSRRDWPQDLRSHMDSQDHLSQTHVFHRLALITRQNKLGAWTAPTNTANGISIFHHYYWYYLDMLHITPQLYSTLFLFLWKTIPPYFFFFFCNCIPPYFSYQFLGENFFIYRSSTDFSGLLQNYSI